MSLLGETERRKAFKAASYVAAIISLVASVAVSQENELGTGPEALTIGVIDFYGLRTISQSEVLAVLPFREGDALASGFLSETLKSKIAVALNVPRVEMGEVCCRDVGVSTVYIGIEESPAAQIAYHSPPTGEIELPEEILQTSMEMEEAVWAAFQTGDGIEEDWSEGHSLADHPEVRALQERSFVYVEEYWDGLLEILYTSSRPRHRAEAASVIAYSNDKAAVVPHLEFAVLDPGVGVRNNATRALSIIAMYANDNPELGIEFHPEIFVDMLNSINWLDRNKGALILSILSQPRDPDLLAQLQARVLPSLIEMCRWKSNGHAFMSCIMLERIVGLPEQDELHPKEATIAMAQELLPSEIQPRDPE